MNPDKDVEKFIRDHPWTCCKCGRPLSGYNKPKECYYCGSNEIKKGKSPLPKP